MKRLWRIALISIMSLVLAVPVVALPAVVSAQAGGPYTSGFEVQNLDPGTATIAITYYAQSGSVAATVNDTIAGSSSKTYFPLTAVSSGFSGSAVVSSDKPVAAIVNVFTSDLLGGGSYNGATAGAATVSLPLIMKGNFGFSTWYNVQNAGSAPANVSVAYAGTACTDTKTGLAVGAAVTFDQSSNGCLPAGYVGSATVTNSGTSQPLVAAVIEIKSAAKNLLAYNGFISSDNSNTPVMPLVSTNFFHSITGIQIQNTGGVNTNVTVHYTPSAGFPGAACNETKTVNAHSATTFFLPFPAACGTVGTGTSGTGGFVGSGKVSANTASQPLVAIVNQINSASANGSAYNGINPAAGTAHVSLPLIMDRNFGYFTGFSVANVGASTTHVNCTFTGSAFTVSGDVAPGTSLTSVQNGQIANGYVGSATCTATGGDTKIAAIVNELGTGAPTSDLLLTYNGVNF